MSFGRLPLPLAGPPVPVPFRGPLFAGHFFPPRQAEFIPPNLLTTTLGVTVTVAPFVYYDFAAHPPPPPPSQFVPNPNTLPQIYTQSPVGAARLSFDATAVVRPGQPERWKGFFDLPQLYAQSPIGSRQLSFDSTAIIRPGQPERWRPFQELASIYAQSPVGVASVEVHPLAPRGNPEFWEGILDNQLPQIYTQAPVGAISVEVHPLAPMGNPERWRSFYDLAYLYAQSPVGATSVEVHPLAPKGNPENWRSFFDLSWVYSQQPVGARQDADGPPAYIKGPEPLPPDLLTTTLGVTVTVTLPFVYYDFSAHPSPVPPSQFVPNPNALPQIYTQSPIGSRWEDDAHPVVRGQPESWRPFFDLSSIYAQTPVGQRWEDDAHPVVRTGTPELWETILNNLLPEIYSQSPVSRYLPDEARLRPIPPLPDVYQNYLLTTLSVTVTVAPFVYYDFSAHPAPLPPSQFVPNINVLPQIYSQQPVGTRQLSFDTPPTIRGNPEAWAAMLNNQLPFIYAFAPIASWFDFGVHAAYQTPAENILFPNLIILQPVIVGTKVYSYITSCYIQ